jgi:L-gulono-1,4-lactone dehydrogenase
VTTTIATNITYAAALTRALGGRDAKNVDDSTLAHATIDAARTLNVAPDVFIANVAQLAQRSSLKELVRAQQLASVDALLGANASSMAANVSRALAHLGTAMKAFVHPPAPSLSWDPGLLQKKAPLDVKGPLAGSPFSSLSEAHEAIKKAKSDDSTFLITRTLAGFCVWRYSESRMGQADLHELDTKSLPVQSWLVDSRGNTGALAHDGTLKRGPLIDTVHGPSAGLPTVVAREQVNHGENLRFTPKMAFRPGTNIDELAAILKYVHEHLPPGTKVKAGGSLHSWSSVAATNGVFIHPEGMKSIDALPRTGGPGDVYRADAKRENLVRVGSGTTVRELNRVLWEQMGKSLPVLGGFDGQTLGGVLPTGTHGSVLKHGPLAEMIRSMDFVRADGTKVRIERPPGLTDPVAFQRAHPDMQLVQDATSFNAAIVHMGTMGVVHSMVLEAVPKFHMNEVRTVTTLDDVKRVLSNGGVYRVMDTDTPVTTSGPHFGNGHPDRAYHMEVLINAHSQKAAITTRQPVHLDKEPANLGERPGRDIIRALQLGDQFTRPVLPTWLSEHASRLLGFIGTVPLVPSTAKMVVDASIDSLKDDAYTQRSYNVFHIGDGANAIPALSSTMFVPLKGDTYLKAVDILQRTAKEFAAETGKYQTGPISMRFVKGSEALMAPGKGEDVCSFELIFAGGTPHAEQMTRRYYEALKRELGSDVTFHWGQLNPGQSADDVKAAYPGAESFKRVRRDMDPSGMFLGEEQQKFFGA